MHAHLLEKIHQFFGNISERVVVVKQGSVHYRKSKLAKKLDLGVSDFALSNANINFEIKILSSASYNEDMLESLTDPLLN